MHSSSHNVGSVTRKNGLTGELNNISILVAYFLFFKWLNKKMFQTPETLRGRLSKKYTNRSPKLISLNTN